MYFKLVVCLVLFIGITSSSPSDWQQFKRDYNKQYISAAEEAERKEIFSENVRQMQEYQRTYSDATFTMGINHLTDRRVTELVSRSKSYFNSRSVEVEESTQQKLNIPDSWDWRDRNVTSSVYDQGQQAKAMAIAGVEVIESYDAIQTGKLQRGSVAQVVSCCPQTSDGLDCILKNLGGGICKESDYNSSATTCDRNACQPYATFNRIKYLPAGNEETMLTWIQDSTLLVGIDAASTAFLTYISGVYSGTTCSQTAIDHVLQLVGYGTELGKPYWLCKNSWGVNWGEEGYIRIERGKNTCGIADFVQQIEYKANDAVQSFHINHLYLTLFSFIMLFFQV